jgi:hypothetical protein
MAASSAHLRPPRRVRAAISKLRDSQPRVADLAAALGVTPRTLHRELLG